MSNTEKWPRVDETVQSNRYWLSGKWYRRILAQNTSLSIFSCLFIFELLPREFHTYLIQKWH